MLLQPRFLNILLFLVLPLLSFGLYQLVYVEFENGAPNIDIPSLTVTKAQSVWFDKKGKPVNKLHATTLYYFQAKDMFWAESSVFEHAEEGTPRLTLSSTRANFDRAKNKIFLYGHTKLIREKTVDQPEWLILSQNVDVDLTHKIAESSSPTIVSIGNNTIDAHRFYADYHHSLLKFSDGVRMKYAETY